MRSILVFAMTVLFCIVFSAQTQAQTTFDYNQSNPFSTLQNGNIDSVNLLTGTVQIRLPFLSLPQKGNSKLDFSILSSGNTYNIQTAYFPDGTGGSSVATFVSGVGDWLSISDNSVGVGAQWLIAVEPSNCYGGINCDSDIDFGWFEAVDAVGGTHQLYEDAENPGTYRAVDGTDYMYTGGKLYSGDGTVTTGTSSINSSGYSASSVRTDPSGNSIAYSSYWPSSGTVNPFSGEPYISSSITDTAGRVFNFPPPQNPTLDISSCPILNLPNQPTIGSEVWSVPGPNGQNTNYLVCFTQFYINTNFLDFGGGSTGGDWGTATEEQSIASPTIQSIVLPNKTYWAYVYDATDSSYSSFAYGSLTKVIFPTGGSISYKYQALAAGEGVEGSNLSCGLLPVIQRTFDSGDGHPHTWNYTYGLLQGFNSQNLLTSTTTLMSDPNDIANDTLVTFSSLSSPDYVEMCGFVETDRKVYQGSHATGSLLEETSTQYQWTPGPYSNLYTIYDRMAILPTSKSISRNGLPVETIQYTYDSGFSAVLDECTPSAPWSGPCGPYGVPATVSRGRLLGTIITDGSTGTVIRDDQKQYVWQNSSAYYGANFLNLLSTDSLYDSNQDLVAQTNYRYDEANGSPQGVYGHLTSVNKWLNTTTSPVKTSFVYNSSGMVTDSYDANYNAGLTSGGHAHYTYDATGIFPSQTQNIGVGQQLTDDYVYDANTGKVLSHADPNNNTTLYQYDLMNRLTSVAFPDKGFEGYTYNDSTTAPSYTRKVQLSPSSTLTDTEKVDGFGRVIESQRADPLGTVYVDTTYDGLGHVASVTNQYRNPSAPGDPPSGLTSFSYDALDRKLLQCQPDNGNNIPCIAGNSYLQWVYNGDSVTSYDEQRNASIQTIDALGRLASVAEAGGEQTSYSYDGLGNLTSVVQYGVGVSDTPRARSFQYDSLSRLLSASNPELGTIQYSYDPDSNLQQKTDARGVITHYQYDGLNRLISKTLTNAPAGSLSSCYQYDATPFNGVGRLFASWTQAGECAGSLPATGTLTSRKILSYDAMGRLKKEQQCTPGNCNVTTSNPYSLYYDYDLAGNLTHANDGIGQASWFQQYDTAGRLTGVSANTVWPTTFYPSQLFSAQSYSPAGGLQNWTMGVSGSGIPALTGVKQYDNRIRPTTEMVTGHD